MAASKSVTAGGTATSDAATMPANTIDAELVIKAKNDGTPAAGDELTIKILATVGDPDADPDSADEYTTAGHAASVAILDTNDEDPAISSPVPIPPSLKGLKVYASSGAGSNGITVSAQLRSTDKDGSATETQITWT